MKKSFDLQLSFISWALYPKWVPRWAKTLRGTRVKVKEPRRATDFCAGNTERTHLYLSPLPLVGEGAPQGRDNGALAGKSTLVPNPLPPVGEGTNSSVLSPVCGAKSVVRALAVSGFFHHPGRRFGFTAVSQT
jgi:hypothetical protein